jgi:acetyl esterase
LQMLFCPMTAIPADNDSYRSFGAGPGMTSAALKCFVAEQFPGDILAHASAFPMASTIRELCGLPEALVITAENDILRDEGEAYARRLMQAEVTVTATRYLGTVHDFLVLDGLSETPPARAALAQAIGGLKACFAAVAMPAN